MNQLNWFAIYTKSRAEKKVSCTLSNIGINNYLPIQKTLKQWSDRKKWVEEPLFRSYIFVKTNIQTQYFSILQIDGVVRFIEFLGKPEPIKDEQIDRIKKIMEYGNFQTIPHVEIPTIGDKLEVIQGPLSGLSGELINYKGKKKVLIKINVIDKNIIVDIPINYLKIF